MWALRRDRRHGAGFPRPAHLGARFRCTTILPHGVACAGLASIYIRKRGRGRWTMADHSHAIRARQAAAPIDAKPGTFATIVKRCEVAFLYRGIASSTSHGAGSSAQDAARRSTCTLATDPVRRGRCVSGRSPKPPTALARLHAATAGLGEAR